MIAVRWEIRELSILRIRGTWLANSDEYANWQSTTIDNSRESRSGSTALLSFTSRVFQTFPENYWAILLIVLEIPANKLKCNLAKNQLYICVSMTRIHIRSACTTWEDTWRKSLFVGKYAYEKPCTRIGKYNASEVGMNFQGLSLWW